MIFRCENPNATGYPRYGGREIKVCDRWRKSFLNFLADMGVKPIGTDIHRKNSAGNYRPGNCIWMDERSHVSLHAKER
jgi:hypothetical protein